MKRKSIRFISICIAVVFMLGLFAGCVKTETGNTEESTTQIAEEEEVYYWGMLDSVQDTSDLPDWTGKQLNLSMWVGHGTGDANHPKSENDVVSPEIKRVTGVEINRDTSFDNAGGDINVKLGMLAAANDWPDVIYTSGTSQLKQVVENDKFYDLTDLLPEYCPHIVNYFLKNDENGKLVGKSLGITESITAEVSDRIYFVPSQANGKLTDDMSKIKADFDPTKWLNIHPADPMNGWPRIWARDDLLKKLYPNAMTQDEIEAVYMENGVFTSEQIFDVPIKSAEDFEQFLCDMKALIVEEDIRENNKPIEVTYAATGGDNWQLMACLLPQMYGDPAQGGYFTIYDSKADELQYVFEQDWFKEQVKSFWELVVDGTVSKESLLDNGQIFNEKVNSGSYAVTYAWTQPDPQVLKDAGETYRYRFIWPDVAYEYDRFPNITAQASTGTSFAIFKDSVKEEDLPQVLRYLDYMCSDPGDKLHYWGPESAGLFKEVDGNRIYKDKELEQNMVYGVDNGRNLYYNLWNFRVPIRCQWPSIVVVSDENMNCPRYTYSDRVRSEGEANTYFNPGTLTGKSNQDHAPSGIKAGAVWEYGDQWNEISKGRDAFEKALTKTLAATDNAQFEELWADMLDVAGQIGMDDSMLAEMDKSFHDSNEGYMEGIRAAK